MLSALYQDAVVNRYRFARLPLLAIAIAACCALAPCQTSTSAFSSVPQGATSQIEQGLGRFQMPASGLGTAGSARTDSSREIPNTFRGWLNRGLLDQKQILVAPFRKKNLKWDALFLAGAGTLIAYDEQAARAVPKDWENASHLASNAAIVATGATLGTIFIHGLKTDNEHAKEMGYIGLEALANTFTIYTATQLIAARERPFEGTGEGSFFKNHSVNTSFPAGHAMFTFAMASVVAHEYPKPWVKALAYGAAFTVAGARFTGRNHFPSDLMVGSLFGYLISTHIFHSHCKAGLSPACHPSDSE
jgi:membrane-associated phospholipid phosphatase